MAAGELFDETTDPVAIDEAIRTCDACPALTRCAAWVATLPDSYVSGVVAGKVYTWVSHPSVRRKASG